MAVDVGRWLADVAEVLAVDVEGLLLEKLLKEGAKREAPFNIVLLAG